MLRWHQTGGGPGLIPRREVPSWVVPERDLRPILVTGATGFIGLEVCRRLDEAGQPFRAVFRRRHRAALVAPLSGELVVANLESPESLRRAVRGCAGVIHLAGRATFEPYERLRPTVVDGTASLVAAAAEEGVERFVLGSSLFVHGAADGPALTAASSTRPDIGYGRAKLEAEALVHQSSAGVSVRLPHVYGWNDLLFEIMRWGVVPFPGDLETRLPHLHVTDAADVLIALAEAPDGPTGPVVVGDDDPVTWRTFFETVRAYLPGIRVLDLPTEPTIAALDVLGRFLGRGRHASMLHGDTVRGWRIDAVLEPGTIRRLGVEPTHPSTATGIPAVLDAARPYRWRHPVLDRRGLRAAA